MSLLLQLITYPWASAWVECRASVGWSTGMNSSKEERDEKVLETQHRITYSPEPVIPCNLLYFSAFQEALAAPPLNMRSI